MSLDNLTQGERENLAKHNAAGIPEVVSLLARSNVDTGYAREATVSGTYFTSITFPETVHFISLYSDMDCYFTWDSQDDSEADSDLDSGNTSHFISAGELIHFGISSGGISRMDFRNDSGSGATTSRANVTAYVKGKYALA